MPFTSSTMSPREADCPPHSYPMDQPRRLVRLSDGMEIQANNGGGYGLVPVTATLSSRGNVLVRVTGLESGEEEGRDM